MTVPFDTATTPGTAPASRQVKLLKALVIGLGVLLVAGLLVVAGTIAYRVSRVPASDAPAVAAMPGAAINSGQLVLPAGASVRSIGLDGNRLAVHYGSADGSEGIVVVDLRSGGELARFGIEAGRK